MEKYLFTIAIPTYNRSKYLDLCLAQICKQLPGYEQSIELIVSDNNSTDDTEEIVRKYIYQGYPIEYIKNEENIGADRNFLQCYYKATGKYVLILGDDDLLLDGFIIKTTKILKEDEYGVIYLNGYSYSDKFIPKTIRKQHCRHLVYTSIKDFIKDTNYKLTFTSGNIFNKSLVDKNILKNTNTICGTKVGLIQLLWILSAALNAKKNAYIEDFMIASRSENSGGYRLAETFGVTSAKIFDLFIAKGTAKKYFTVINRNLVRTFFPNYIFTNRTDAKKYNFTKEDYFKILYPLYREYPSFWLFTVPIIKLPLPLAYFWSFAIRRTRKIQRIPGFFLRLSLKQLSPRDSDKYILGQTMKPINICD